jgi:hypothetical protein
MSQTSSSNAPAGKPRANLYTVLLIIALLAIIVGTIFMYVESLPDSRTGMGPATSAAAATMTVAHANLPADVAAPGMS